MECSQAVLMLMLLVPCEQSGGQSPETVIVEQREAAPVADQPLPAEPVLEASMDAIEARQAATPGPLEPAERGSSGDQRVSDRM